MLRRLAIVVLFAGVLPIYGQEKSSQSVNNQSNSDASKRPELSSRTANCKIKDDGTTVECYWAESKPDGYFKRLRSPENAPNIGLVFIGLGGVIAALLTLRAIYTQAGLMQRQIDLMKIKERADLTITFEYHDFVHPTLWQSQEHPELAVSFTVLVRNIGITRAKNVAFYGAATVTPTKSFPPMSDAQRVMPFQDMFKAESDAVGVEIYTGKPYPVVDDGERIRVEDAFLHLYGFVAFTDVFGDRLIRPFRWLWKSEEFDVDGITADSSGWIDVAWFEDAKVKEPYYYEHLAN